MESSKSILTKIFTEYYLTGAQAKKDGTPVAFITAFAPVEREDGLERASVDVDAETEVRIPANLAICR